MWGDTSSETYPGSRLSLLSLLRSLHRVEILLISCRSLCLYDIKIGVAYMHGKNLHAMLEQRRERNAPSERAKSGYIWVVVLDFTIHHDYTQERQGKTLEQVEITISTRFGGKREVGRRWEHCFILSFNLFWSRRA